MSFNHQAPATDQTSQGAHQANKGAAIGRESGSPVAATQQR